MKPPPLVLDWLLEGDPAIRWQVMRDLEGAAAEVWSAERQRVVSEGWGADLLAKQDEPGTWGGGAYSPKWTSTVYTLLQLRDIGVTAECGAAGRGAELAIGLELGKRVDAGFLKRLARVDLCVVGMLVSVGSCFGSHDERLEAMVGHLLEFRMADGAWNCRHRRGAVHSSFHTTFNVLDGLQDYLECGPGRRREEIVAARDGALEFMLEHRLFRSDKTGAVINPRFLKIAYPPRWHYDVLRGLDFFRRVGADRDGRLADAVEMLVSKRDGLGRWKVEERYAGVVFFHLESLGKASRWNTLRGWRVLRWWES
jgi:hypothetical protein